MSIKQLVNIEGVPTMVLQSELTQREDGSYYTNYNIDMTVDMVAEDKIVADKKISDIRAKAGKIILAKYPIWKQINLSELADDDVQKVEYLAFKNSIIDISNVAETNLTALADIEWGV
ncbi:MAG: hypothetical protein KAQ94_06045 [Arcobacteraceae bacterium]|nr:hypothetical protein [Arcobacteraceae bacterium]